MANQKSTLCREVAPTVKTEGKSSFGGQKSAIGFLKTYVAFTVTSLPTLFPPEAGNCVADEVQLFTGLQVVVPLLSVSFTIT